MLRERDMKTAERFDFADKIQKLHDALMNLNGVSNIDYDLSGFWSDIQEVIILPSWDLPFNGYYERRKQLLIDILQTLADHGLRLTGDTIEDYGRCWYIVTECNWLNKKAASR